MISFHDPCDVTDHVIQGRPRHVRQGAITVPTFMNEMDFPCSSAWLIAEKGPCEVQFTVQFDIWSIAFCLKPGKIMETWSKPFKGLPLALFFFWGALFESFFFIFEAYGVDSICRYSSFRIPTAVTHRLSKVCEPKNWRWLRLKESIMKNNGFVCDGEYISPLYLGK